jgi:putative tryptophan/tyrosine transport system substrate-binding protein
MRFGPARLAVAFLLGLFGWWLPASAQQPAKVPRIAILSDETSSLAVKFFEPFAQGLRDLGWVEGQNITFERRYGEGENKILPSLATGLVGLQPEVIVAVGTPAARAAKIATKVIPIVFARIADPIGSGLVVALGRPGGNLTGVTSLSRELAAKRLELLITAVPGARRIGVLWDPDFPPDRPQLTEIEGAAPILNLELLPAEVRRADDFQLPLRAMAERHADAIIVLPGEVFDANAQRIADLTAKARLPTMFQRRELVEAGGLMSYGTNYPDMYRRAATYVDKILKGAKPADLPVEQPTRFELVINLKTAKALGLTIPLTLLGRADEVIE